MLIAKGVIITQHMFWFIYKLYVVIQCSKHTRWHTEHYRTLITVLRVLGQREPKGERSELVAEYIWVEAEKHFFLWAPSQKKKWGCLLHPHYHHWGALEQGTHTHCPVDITGQLAGNPSSGRRWPALSWSIELWLFTTLIPTSFGR